MPQVCMVSHAGRVARSTVGRFAHISGYVAVVVAAFVLGACTPAEPPVANWRTTSEPATPLNPIAPMGIAPSMPASEPAVHAPMAPSVQTLPDVPPARNPCLTKWGSPRLDAPADICGAKGPRASRALPVRGVYKIGKPYTVAGKTYVPAENPNYEETGTASWYGDGFHGKPTANGEVYNMHGLSAAHRTLPMPSFVYVHNPVNGRTIMVRVNNRGPLKGNRIIDLSREAARLLDFKARGLATVRVTYAGKAPLDGSDHAELEFLQQQHWYRQETALTAR